ncbi:ABC transporter permease [Pseudobacteroides cellulosolvens]|uniref:ABC transporter permease n=1 Tax=Pseudobacteroides cellulosolvens ATCC 35603 = DSM 2933 TaxID=398512 RepID=A0A0L6JR57_9FIRM|nr:ABC transporter permease [Pseudobacteroides cellulosolvens]KNY28321.1 hypothetical protein Bccel_3595 [Pseudobacteroides cellulosolvens ATCC 35603 = DSM 2933]
MFGLLKCEFRKFRSTYINSLSFLGMLFPLIILVLTFAIKKNDWIKSGAYNWDGFNQQLSVFFIFLVGPIITSFISVFSIFYEFQVKTLKNMLNSPFSRTSIIISKIIYVSLFVILQYVVVAALNILSGFILGFDMSFAKACEYSLRLVLAGLSTVSLVPLMTLVTLLFKNFIPAMVLTVIGTIANVLALNWDKSYLSPWAIPADISFVAISKNSTMNIIHPIIFMCIYIVLFSVCTVVHFNLSDQSA